MDKLKGKLRASQHKFLTAIGKAETTTDRDFDALLVTFQGVEKSCAQTLKHLNGLIEMLHGLSSHINFISEDFLDASDPNAASTCTIAGEQLEKCTNLNDASIRSFEELMRHDCIAHLQTFMAIFPQVQELVDQRRSCLMEYDFRRSKVKALTEKPPKDPVKLQRAREKLLNARTDFDNVNTQAKSKLQEMTRKHKEIIDPIADCLMRSLISYFSSLGTAIGSESEYGRLVADRVRVRPPPSQQVAQQPEQPRPRRILPPVAASSLESQSQRTRSLSSISAPPSEEKRISPPQQQMQPLQTNSITSTAISDQSPDYLPAQQSFDDIFSKSGSSLDAPDAAPSTTDSISSSNMPLEDTDPFGTANLISFAPSMEIIASVNNINVSSNSTPAETSSSQEMIDSKSPSLDWKPQQQQQQQQQIVRRPSLFESAQPTHENRIDTQPQSSDGSATTTTTTTLKGAHIQDLRWELDVDWFYLDALNAQKGPVPFSTLKTLYQHGGISDSSFVFGGEMEAWATIKTLPKLRTLLTHRAKH